MNPDYFFATETGSGATVSTFLLPPKLKLNGYWVAEYLFLAGYGASTFYELVGLLPKLNLPSFGVYGELETAIFN